jgi:hypothetical protein
MAVNPVLRQLVADGKATKNAQSGTQTKMTAAKSAAQSTPMRRSLSNQQKTTSGTKKTDALTSAIISTNQKAAQKKTNTAERGSKHYTNRANQQRRAQAQVVANQIKKNNAERANKYSLGKGVAGAVAKGVNQAAQGVASTLALAEDVLLSPFELLSGQKLGDLSDTAPLNKLSQRIKNEGQETQKKYADNVAKGGKAAELLDKYGSATVAAVPQAVMAYLTAGASAGASTAGLGAQAAAKMTPSMAGTIRRGVAAMAKDPNYWTAFSQVVGQSYDEAMDDMAKTGTENNKARTKAALYAMGNGLLNAAVEVGGGIQKLPEELKHGAAAWKAWVNSMVDEGKEEVVQGVIERAMQNSVYDKGNPLASVSDPDAILNPRTAAKEFAGGAIVGGVLGAGQIGAQKVLESRNNRATPQQPTQQAPGAQADVREGTYTTTPANAAEGTQNAAPGVETAANKGETVQIVERLRESIPGLNGTEPVSTVSSKAIPFVEGRTMAEKARKMFEAIKGVVSRPGFGDIDINGRSVKDDLSHGVGGAKAAVIPAIPEVLRRGQQIDFQQNWKGRPYDGYVFAAPVTMDGETAYVAAVVKRTSKNRFYLHEVIDANGNVIKIDAGDRANPTSLATNGDAGTQSQASVEGTRPLNANDSIAQGAENVKNSGSRDILSEVLFGRNRVDLNTMTEAQQDAVFRANEEGTVGMDATGKVFQIDPEQHIDRRRMETVGGRDVNAFQFDHPELHRYYQEAANALIADADLSLQQPMSRRYERTMEGNAVQQAAQTSPHLRQAMNETGLSRDSIIDAAERIVTDHGQENVAAAKRVELILDDMLSHGYTTMTGEQVGPNSGYLTAKQSILGAGEQARGRGLEDVDAFDTPGDAVAGAVNTPFDAMQAKSDEFYPVNPNSAQRIQAEQRRAPSEVPVMNPDTGRNVEKTVSTILNSSLTSPEMATVYENAISGGAFDYDVVTDRSAVQQAQAKIARDGWREVANSFVAKAELGQRITKADTADAISAYNLAISEGDHKAAFELATAIADAAHDSAQMVQAMNLMNRLTPEGRLLTLRRLVDRMNDRAARQNRTPRQSTTDSGDVEGARVDYIDKVTGFTLSDELATNYLMAETDAERAAAWDAITTSIADQIPSTFMEKANFWRYTSMLTNPTTHIRNIMGNAIQMGARKIKNGIGTAIERAVIKDPSQRTKAVNVDKDLKAFAKGQYETDQSAAMGSGKYSDATTAGIEREIQSKRKMFKGEDVLSRAVQGIGDLNSRALDYEDVIFNRAAYVDSFAQALQAKGVTAAEAHAGTRAADVEAARAYAIEEAQRATYRNTTALSEALSQFGRYEGDNPVKRAGSFVADALFPFRKTPANILTTGLDYSPIGLVKGIKEALFDVKSGKCTASDAVDSLASGLTGTGILALGAYLAAEGLLHVRAGDDDKEEAFEKSMGGQNYAIQIGDKSYTLDWAVPAAMPLFAGAAIMESVRKGGGTFDALVDSLLGMQDVVLETSMLSSLNDLISYWSYADNKVGYLLDRAASSYDGQYIPTIGSKVASVFDDTVRKSYVEKGSGQVASDVNYFLQGAAKKVPGVRNRLQPSIDLWGNEVSNGSAPERVFQSFISPGFLKAQDNSPATQEIRRLAKATGESAVYPAAAEKSFMVNGETKYLTGEEYTKYAKTMGSTRKQIVENMLKSKGYQKLSDDDKAKAISYAYEYANVKGKQAVSSYKPSNSSFSKGALASVLPPDMYILYKVTADKDNNGRVTSVESAQALENLTGLTDRQRGKAWEEKNSTTKPEKNPFTGALVEAGASVSTSISILDKYRELYNADGMKPKEKAADFRAYVYGLGLTPSQIAAAQSTYTFFGSYPIEW